MSSKIRFHLNIVKHINNNKSIEQTWNTKNNIYLHKIKRDIYSISPPVNLERQYQVKINCIRISHSHLTYSYLLKKKAPSLCNTCSSKLSLEHLITACPAYFNARSKYKLNKNIATILKITQKISRISYSFSLQKIRRLSSNKDYCAHILIRNNNYIKRYIYVECIHHKLYFSLSLKTFIVDATQNK